MLPDTPERARQELDLQITLGQALWHTRGRTALDIEHTYTRARELCQQIGDTPQLFAVLRGLHAFYIQQAELQTGRELAAQLLTLVLDGKDSARLVESHRALGATLVYLGEFSQAQVHLEQCLTLYNPPQQRAHALRYGFDPKVNGLMHNALLLWLLGYPDQALSQSHAALGLSKELAHPYSLAIALGVVYG